MPNTLLVGMYMPKHNSDVLPRFCQEGAFCGGFREGRASASRSTANRVLHRRRRLAQHSQPWILEESDVGLCEVG